MKFHLKKSILIITIISSIFSAYAFNVQDSKISKIEDDINLLDDDSTLEASANNSTSTPTPPDTSNSSTDTTNYTDETSIDDLLSSPSEPISISIIEEHYDENNNPVHNEFHFYQDSNVSSHNLSSKDIDNLINRDMCSEKSNLHNNINDDNRTQSFDCQLPEINDSPTITNNIDNINNSKTHANEQNILDNLLRDDIIDQRQDSAEYNQKIQQNNTTNHNNNTSAIDTFDKYPTTINLARALSSQEVKQEILETKDSIIQEKKINKKTWSKEKILRTKKEIKFCNTLLSNKIMWLMRKTTHRKLHKAETASKKLKKLWLHNYIFGVFNIVEGSKEKNFISKLGNDLMHIVERDLITRQDYIDKYANTQIIQQYKKDLLKLQKKGLPSLYQEQDRLRDLISKNNNNADITTKICLAIVEKKIFSPITITFHEITHAPSLKEAHTKLKELERNLSEYAKVNNIIHMSDLQKVLIQQHDCDVLKEARDCYTSRSDYITKENQSHISNPVNTVLQNIENRCLPEAHAELVHLNAQVTEGLASLDITDPIAQKKYLIGSFGKDIIEHANNTYKKRNDHQELVNSFIPIDVRNASINILNNNFSFENLSDQFHILTRSVLRNAKLCDIKFIPEIEAAAIESLQVIRAPRNNAEFIFNVTIIDHIPTDMQTKTESIVEGKPTTWQDRSSELFIRGITKFVHNLNPITQASNMGDLVILAGTCVKNVALAAAEEIRDPIGSCKKDFFLAVEACEALVHGAKFAVDLVIGHKYLPPEEYKQRTDRFKNACGAIINAENAVDLVAQVSADFVWGKGFASVSIYLREIDAMSKLGNYAGKVANRIKQAIENSPAAATAEGLALKMSKNLKKASEKIKNSATVQTIIIKVANMKEFFALPFGQVLFPHSFKTSHQYQNFSIYKLTNDIPGTNLKEGFFYYLDSLHRDHLEVFNKKLKVVGVYNLDGTFNQTKFEAARQAGRNIKKIM